MEDLLVKARIEKYPSYKDSGILWLGEIPSHWKMLSNKHIFTLKKYQVGKKSGNYVLLSLTLNGVIKRDMENPQGKFPAEFDTYQEVKRGDFIFCLFDVEETPRAVGLSEYDGMITGAYTVMEPHPNFDKRFLYYFYLNLDADKRMRSLYKGLRNTIPKESFFSFKTFVPPLEEQTTIASFLDRKTAQIDKAISIKEKQIELLKERRQILIHRAVTRGLNPSVKMKDSGVEWIGEIPEHWEVLRLKNIAEIKMGFAFPSEKFGSDGIPVIRIGDLLSSGYVDTSNCPRLPEKYIGFLKRFGLNNGDILMAMTGGTIGKIAEFKLDEIALLNQRVCSFKVRDNFSRDLILYWMKSNYWMEYILFKAYGGAQPNISDKDVLECNIVISKNLDEQLAIADRIKKVTIKIANAMECKEKEIEKLKEYKATLINSAVTGKIKVTQDA
jgi:type I restriction enzyme S subunit